VINILQGRCHIRKGKIVFVLVVAFLCVASIGMIAFTDVIEDSRSTAIKTALAQLVRHLRRQ
jgi:hypothetical protein